MRLVLVREEGGFYEYPSLRIFLADWRAVPIFGFRLGRRMVLFDRIVRDRFRQWDIPRTAWRSHVMAPGF
jgi:hypothetical protein